LHFLVAAIEGLHYPAKKQRHRRKEGVESFQEKAYGLFMGLSSMQEERAAKNVESPLWSCVFNAQHLRKVKRAWE